MLAAAPVLALLAAVPLGDPCPGVGRLAVSSGESLDFYGEAVAVTGGWAAASSVFFDHWPAEQTGVLDIWRETGAGWILHDQLQPFELPDVDALRRPLAADGGDTLAVAAWDATGPGSGIGRVVVLRRNGLTWGLETVLSSGVESRPGDPGDGFGSSVALSGDRLAVGAQAFSDVAEQQGRVHTYRFDGSGWVSTGVLMAPNPGAIDRFGAAVALSGTHLAVSATGVDQPVGPDGAVYLYELVGGAWVLRDQTDPLTPSDPLDGYGRTLAISGGHVFVGAPQPSGLADPEGSVHVYRIEGAGLLDDQLITQAVDNGLQGHTGIGLAFSAGRLFVGSPTSFDPGSVSVFQQVDSVWVEQQSLQPCDGVFGDGFGAALDAEGGRLLVGAPGDDGPFGQWEAYGAVHAWALDGATFAEGDELTLGAEPSASRGGVVSYRLRPDSPAPGASYVVLGSISGTTPGVTLKGQHVPLNVDPWFELLLGFPAGGLFQGFSGPLTSGTATTAALVFPPALPPVVVGVRFDHAWLELLGGQILSVSEAEGFVFDL